MIRSSADRLRGLRVVLTALFTAVNALGLVVVAWLLVDTDADRRAQRLDDELHRVTSTVHRLLRAEGTDSVDTAGVDADQLNDQCPQFAVMPGAARAFPAKLSGKACLRVDVDALHRLTQRSLDEGAVLTVSDTGPDGALVRMRVDPFRAQSGRYVGAVVAIADAQTAQDEHERRIALVVGGSLLLVGLLGLAGWVLSGRAIRPAAAALEQQEVLLAETAHDLRTPVAALRSLAETAQRHPDQAAELLPRTVALSAEMGGIIDGLLVRARLAAGVDRLAVQPVWLDQLVGDVVEDTPKGGAEVTLTAAATAVMVDNALVRRAVGNLLDNALRHGRQPGQEAVVHITVAGGRVTVADHGPGVDGSVANEVFDRFRTGSGGTGLGLSIVRWVAQAHGGRLNLYNAEEGGAIFELELPLAPQRR